jgi:hypothetical protein
MVSRVWGVFFMTDLCAVLKNYISGFMCNFLDVSGPVLESFKF